MKIISGISEHDIYHELQSVLNFSLFKNSPTLGRFLEYIVTEKVNGRANCIKEYSIAIDVLDRSPNFSPHDDAIVRIHAGRLRRILNEYYLTEGVSDPLLIYIPKGCYVPEFKRVDKVETIDFVLYDLPPVETKPIVAVLPFKSVSPGEKEVELSLLLQEELSSELSRFQEISVIGYYSTEMITNIHQNVLEAGKLIGADYILTGNLQCNNQKIRIRVNLMIVSTGEIVMTKFLETGILYDIFEIQDEIVSNVISIIGGFYGLIFQQIGKACPIKVSNNKSFWESIYDYYKYKRSFSIENYNAAVTILRHSIDVNPNNALSWAMLSELYFEGSVFRIKNVEIPQGESYRCASEALRIDSSCQHAWFTNTLVNLFKKDKEACLNSARECVRLNPNCSALVSGVAVMLICAGYFDEGFSIMEKAFKTTTYLPWWVNSGFTFYYLQQSNYTAAFYWAERMRSADAFWDPLLKSVTLAYMDEKDDAGKYLDKLLEIEPEIPKEINNILSNIILSDELKEKIVVGLETAGLQMLN